MAEAAPHEANQELPPDFQDLPTPNLEQASCDPQQLEDFRTHTPDGQAIAYHQNGLKDVELMVDLALHNAVNKLPGVDPTDMRSPAQQLAEKHTHEHNLRLWAQQSGLAIDFNAIDRVTRDYGTPHQRLDQQYVQRLRQDQQYVRELRNFLGDRMTQLDELERQLVEHPEFRIGSSVPMLRTGKDGQQNYIQEEGWEVVGILANGNLLTADRQEGIEKAEPIERLTKWRDFLAQHNAANEPTAAMPILTDAAPAEADNFIREQQADQHERLAYPNLKYGVAERATHGDDRNLALENIGLFLVCDGVSTAQGAIGAQIAKDTIRQLFENKTPEDYANANPDNVAQELQQALQEASNTVAQQADKSGTTGTLTLVLPSGVVVYAQAGDSRLYHLEKASNTLTQITTDETIGALLEAEGITDQAILDKQSSILTNWLGTSKDTESPTPMRVTQAGHFRVNPGDAIAIFSDGIPGDTKAEYPGDEALIEWMSQENPQASAQNAVDNAIKNDDRTAQIVHIG